MHFIFFREMINLKRFLPLILTIFVSPTYAQLTYKVEMQNTTGTGNHNPLWLNANKYGLSSLDTRNGYVRGAVMKSIQGDSLRKWAVGYCADIVAPYNFTSNFVIQQAYLDVRWHKAMLTVGSKEQPMEQKNQELSSGSQCFGINSRPIPQVRLSLPDFWNIPGTNGFLAFKGYISYGILSDGEWQEHFNSTGSKYQKNVLYCGRAGYIRLGNEKRHPLEAMLGLEMATTFGGSVYSNGHKYSYSSGLKDYVSALIPFNGNDDKSLYTAEGNMLGSLLISVSYKFNTWKLRAYTDHYFEDGSQMYLLDYDAYGSGNDWNKKVGNRFLVYDPKDGMYGIEVTLPKNRFVSSFVGEYLHTKYQSGPVYYDHTKDISDHIGGRDDYYNHGTYVGWQHWGQVAGNPLYLSSIYNEDGSLYIRDNRFVSWHFGINGDPVEGLHYRILMTWQKGWGTYFVPYSDVKRSYNLLAEVGYTMPERIGHVRTHGWSAKMAFGLDDGMLRGNNRGFQFTLSKTGILNFKKK